MSASESTPDVEEIPWQVDDPEDATVIDEDRGILITTMPTGVKLGWDTCGCGAQVSVCGCEKITLPRYVLKMRAREQSYVDALAYEALEASGSDEKSEPVEETGETAQDRGEASSGECVTPVAEDSQDAGAM